MVQIVTPGRFEYTGTRDYKPFATLPPALQFIDAELGGIENMRFYNRNLLLAGSRLIVDKWNTSYLVILNSNHLFKYVYPINAQCFLFDSILWNVILFNIGTRDFL